MRERERGAMVMMTVPSMCLSLVFCLWTLCIILPFLYRRTLQSSTITTTTNTNTILADHHHHHGHQHDDADSDKDPPHLTYHPLPWLRFHDSLPKTHQQNISLQDQSHTQSLQDNVLPSSSSSSSYEKTHTAHQDVERLMEELRRSADVYDDDDDDDDGHPNEDDSVLLSRGISSSCEGRKVYIYDLPPMFNVELVGLCESLIPWTSMCDFFSNAGMGKSVMDVDDQKEKQKQKQKKEKGKLSVPNKLEKTQIKKFGEGKKNPFAELVPFEQWFDTHQYSLEILFHERLKRFECLSTNPGEANLFYIPYYGGLDVLRWHFASAGNASIEQRDRLGLELIKWLRKQPTWGRNKGKDHVLVLGKSSWDFRRPNNNNNDTTSSSSSSGGGDSDNSNGWGNNLLLQPEMQEITKLLIERQPWHPHDVGVPHPTFFHPRIDRDVRDWQGVVDGSERTRLVSLDALQHTSLHRYQTENINPLLIRQCLDGPEGACIYSACGGEDTDNSDPCTRPPSIMHFLLHSEFCLQPPGDHSVTRRSLFDSLIAGCIPVLFDPFTAYYQYPWHLPSNPSSYSVYIPAFDIREGKVNVIHELQKIPVSVRQKMRVRIIYEIMPGLVYARPNSKLRDVEDAFLISMRSLFSKVAKRLSDEDA